jgi:hypothetical protein
LVLFLRLVDLLICAHNKIGTSNGKATDYFLFYRPALGIANFDWLIAQQWRILFPFFFVLRKQMAFAI